jgi:hypothetical protein
MNETISDAADADSDFAGDVGTDCGSAGESVQVLQPVQSQACDDSRKAQLYSASWFAQ